MSYFCFVCFFSFQNHAGLTSITKKSICYKLFYHAYTNFLGLRSHITTDFVVEIVQVYSPTARELRNQKWDSWVKIKVLAELWSFLAPLEGKPSLCLSGSQNSLYSLACDPFYLKNQPTASPILPMSHLITLILLWLGSFPLLDPVITLDHPDNPGQSSLFYGQPIRNLSSVCNLNSPLPYNVTYSQIPGIGMWTSMGGCIFLPTIIYIQFVGVLHYMSICVYPFKVLKCGQMSFLLLFYLLVEQYTSQSSASGCSNTDLTMFFFFYGPVLPLAGF